MVVHGHNFNATRIINVSIFLSYLSSNLPFTHLLTQLCMSVPCHVSFVTASLCIFKTHARNRLFCMSFILIDFTQYDIHQFQLCCLKLYYFVLFFKDIQCLFNSATSTIKAIVPIFTSCVVSMSLINFSRLLFQDSEYI